MTKPFNPKYIFNKKVSLTLFKASKKGLLTVVKLLVKHGSKLEVENEAGETALQLSAFEGHKSTTKFLIEKGCNIEARNKLGSTPLHLASCQGHLSVVQSLLDRGASLEFKDEHGRTALHCAVTEGHLVIVKHLFDKGLKTNKWNVKNSVSVITFKLDSILKNMKSFFFY